MVRYVSETNGIVLSYSDIVFEEEYAALQYDCPFLSFWIRVKWLVWSPVPGTLLQGRISLQSHQHIALLVYKTFNANIPCNHIPSDVFEFNKGVWVDKRTDTAVGSDQALVSFVVEKYVFFR